MKYSDRLTEFWLGAALFLQSRLISPSATTRQAILYDWATAGLVLAVTLVWRFRKHLNSHIDMIMIMCASGGLGVLLGSPSPGHGHHRNGPSEACIWLLLLGLIPSIFLTRCLQTARRLGYLSYAVGIETCAMVAAIWLSTPSTADPNGRTTIGQHMTMLFAMVLGSLITMSIRNVVFTSRKTNITFSSDRVSDPTAGRYAA